MAVKNPTRLSNVARYALRYGGLALLLVGLALVAVVGAAMRSGKAVAKPPARSDPDPDVATGA